MDVFKYLTVLIVLYLEGGETGGGGKHQDHVKLHIPEFHHHDHHKKVITIHHHHHEPKKEQHHHHHHHHKPQIPQGHLYSHHHKKVQLKTQTVSKGGAGHHGHHGHHHKHHEHHRHHAPQHQHHGHAGHHGNTAHHSPYGHEDHLVYGFHNDVPVVPSVSYTPNAFPSYEDKYSSGPSYGSSIPVTGFTPPQVPQIHGVSHTVKQVKLFDSLPGTLPNKDVANGYEVTENGEEGEEAFISLGNLPNTYPATYGYIQAAAPTSTKEPFGGVTSHNSIQQSFDPFSIVDSNSKGLESFTGPIQNNAHQSFTPAQITDLASEPPSSNYPVFFEGTDFDDPENSFTGSDVEDTSFISNDENAISDIDPVTFTREAGIQHTTNTGNVQSLVY